MGCCFANLFLLSGEECKLVPCCMEERALHPFCTLVVVASFSFILVSERRMSSKEVSQFLVGTFSLPYWCLAQKSWERFSSHLFLPTSFPCWIHIHPPVLNMSWRVCSICTSCSLLCHSSPTDPFQGWPCLLTFLLSPSTHGLSYTLVSKPATLHFLQPFLCRGHYSLSHFSRLSVAVAPGSVLDENKTGFPAFSGIARLTWLIDLFGDLTVTSATREKQKDKNYSRMTVHFQTANKKWVMAMVAGEPGCLGVVCRSSASSLSHVETEWVDAGMTVYKRNRPESASYSNHG